jgi:hypothetical protein
MDGNHEDTKLARQRFNKAAKNNTRRKTVENIKELRMNPVNEIMMN